MTDSTNSRLLAALVLATILLPAAAKEPNLPATEVLFETSEQSQSWLIRDEKSGAIRPHISVEPEPDGVIKPTHVAIVYINELHSKFVEYYVDEKHNTAMNTSAVQSTSQKQREFIRATQHAVIRRIEGARPFLSLWLYAVSPDDARKMAQGVIEYITDIADKNVQVTRDAIPERQGKIALAKKQLPNIERLSEHSRGSYQRAKDLSFYSAMDDEQAGKEVIKTMLEMDKMLDLIDVEIGGIDAKIAAIEHFQSQGLVSLSRDRLAQMMLEVRVELAGAQSRREGVLKLRKRQEDLYDLYSTSTRHAKMLADLKNGLRRDEQALKRARETLANPGSYYRRPEIRGNKVVVYPVAE